MFTCLVIEFRSSSEICDNLKNNNARNIYKIIKNYHKDNFFIKFAKFNTPIGTGDIMNTNFCNISVCKSREKNKVIITQTIYYEVLKNNFRLDIFNKTLIFHYIISDHFSIWGSFFTIRFASYWCIV